MPLPLPAHTSTTSGGSLALAAGDGNTSGGSVNIEGVIGTICIILGRSHRVVGTATSSGSATFPTSNAGLSGVYSELSMMASEGR